MASTEVEVVTPTEGNNVDNSQWLNENDYNQARQNIAKWPEWKRQSCNTGIPGYAKPF